MKGFILVSLTEMVEVYFVHIPTFSMDLTCCFSPRKRCCAIATFYCRQLDSLVKLSTHISFSSRYNRASFAHYIIYTFFFSRLQISRAS